MNTINVENCKTLLIGRRGENEVTTVAFDFTEWASEFGSGVVDLYVKRFGDNSAYPVVLTIDGTVAIWLVTETDTNVAGYGKAEYVYRVDGKIAKSAVFPFFVAEDIGQPASEAPDPYESWLEQLTALGAETEAHAQAAEQSAENAAESAEDAAESAASAEGYAGQAETAAGLAQAAQTASEAARDAAQTAQASAEASATAANGSAASAAGSATAAAGSASDASASATSAGASATAAGNAATQAEAAKTAAQTAQSAAEDAAADAQQAAQQAHVEYEQLSGEVDDLTDEVSQQKSAIEDLEALTNRKAGMLIDTASGAVASFVPDSTIPDLLGVSVDIEPVQDLHGQDAPYPPGGGKNVLDFKAALDFWGATYTENADGSFTVTNIGYGYSRPYQFASEDATYTMSAVSLVNGSSASGWGVDFVNASGNTTGLIREGSLVSAGKTACKIRLNYSQPGDGFTIKNIQIEAGSTATAYAPYSNLCPIYGWESVELERAGVNVWDEEWELGQYNNSTGQPISANDCIRTKNPIGVKPNESYYTTYGVGKMQVFFYTADDTFLSQTWVATNIITTPNNCRKMRFRLAGTYGTTYNHDIAINYPSTDHAYHPYAGNRYTITLGQTVYGGTLDVDARTLTVDRAIDVYDGSSDELWARSGTGTYVLINASVKGDTTPISNLYLMQKAPTSGYTIRPIGNDNFASVTEWKTFLSQNNLEVVYEIATPIEISITPAQIAAIAGQTNNVWAVAGDVSVEFAADLKHYIDSKIAAAVAALS